MGIRQALLETFENFGNFENFEHFVMWMVTNCFLIQRHWSESLYKVNNKKIKRRVVVLANAKPLAFLILVKFYECV